MLVTIDPNAYTSKEAAKRDLPAITRRMQQIGPYEVSAHELACAITDGCTWCGGTFEPSPRGWGRFVSMQVAALDFDNDGPALDGKGKRDLMPGEDGFLDPGAAVERFRSLFGRDPLCVYPTLSYRYPGRCKFCLVLDFGERVRDQREAKRTLDKLLSLFPEADRACRNVNRLYLGSCGRCALYDGEGGATKYEW